MLHWFTLQAAFWSIGAAVLVAIGVDSNEPIDLRLLQAQAQQRTTQTVALPNDSIDLRLLLAQAQQTTSATVVLPNDPPTLASTRSVPSPPDPAPPHTGPTVGTVTWYGGHSLLDGQRTAWGEIYDPDDPTTAATALLRNASGEWVVPLWEYNTRLRVCHEEQCLVVRITDTCPACLNPEYPGAGDILLDLSRAAFQELAPLTEGRLRVEISELE